MQLGDVIASIRRLKRIHQEDLAKKLKIGPTYLSQIEQSRKRPSIKLLKAIAKELNTPLEKILLEVIKEKYPKNEDTEKLFRYITPLMKDIIAVLIDPLKKY
jgi:transcriptional regulator with XRE-family HTH domain